MGKLVESIDREFTNLHKRSQEFILRLSADLLYRKPNGGAESCGEQILRSAAAVEQSFGGLSANLWDDPFEWTLPETLNTPARLLEYLDEVETTRRSAFDAFQRDADLSKEIMTPAGRVDLHSFLLDTLRRARHHHQRAVTIFELLND